MATLRNDSVTASGRNAAGAKFLCAALAKVLCAALALGAGAGACARNLGDSASGDELGGSSLVLANSVGTAAPATRAPAGHTATGAGSGGVIGSSPLRRLTHRQYDATVADLLGTRQALAQAFPRENAARGYTNQADVQAPSLLLIEWYAEAAAALAQEAVADPARRAALVPCQPRGAADRACMARFVRAFTLRAFRRPAPADEIDALLSVGLAHAAEENDFWHGVATVVEVALQSPWFLYRVELGWPSGDGSGLLALDGFAVANRISYLLTGTMPDAPLLDAAARRQLETPQQIEGQAQRLLATQRARATVQDFLGEWLGYPEVEELAKDGKIFKKWKAKIPMSMVAESARFFDHLVWESDQDFFTFLTADYTFINKDLAAIYGVSKKGLPGGMGTARVTLPPDRRGYLGQGSFLSLRAGFTRSSPTHRGLFIRERLLCDEIPPPPPGVNFSAVEPGPDKPASGRERYAEHVHDSCIKCHRFMDPLGFGLEKYDGIGVWRDKEGDQPVDESGILEMKDGTQKNFTGLVELAQLLYQSPEVKRCMMTEFSRWWLGRAEEPADRALIDQVAGRFADANYSFKALLMAASASDATRLAAP